MLQSLGVQHETIMPTRKLNQKLIGENLDQPITVRHREFE